MAKRVKPADLQKFRVKDDNGRFEFRSTVIVDEANRIGECSFAEVLPLLGPFKRLSVLGDRTQGGVFSSKNKRVPCLLSFLEERKSSSDDGVVKKTFLNRQYRMIYDIGCMVSKVFYDTKLLTQKCNSGRNLFFHNVRGSLKDNNLSLSCESEAELATAYAKVLLRKHRNSTVGILCYYHAQKTLIARLMRGVNSRNLRVSTVDSYQGKEVDYVVLSTCAQNNSMSWYLAMLERACVACSRGKYRLILLGHRRVLMKVDPWKQILGYMVPIEGKFCDEHAVR